MEEKVRYTEENELISRLFFKMLPVQILIFAMGSVNSIVDGTIAGRFIDSSSVGVIGLYYSMVNVFNAVGSVLLGGSAVLCGRFMGRGDRKKTEGVFSLNLTLTFIIGVLLTLISFVFPRLLAVVLGADEALIGDLATYITGYAIGILPMLLGQQIASFLQMERQSKRGYLGIAGMIISNISLDVLMVAVLRMGIFGLAISTSLSNIVYFLILAPYYLSSKAQLHYNYKEIPWELTPELIHIGMPGALLVFCLALRGVVINRVLLTWSGQDGLSAMSAFNMVNGIFIAYCIGNGSVVRMLSSVYVGEEDKISLKQIMKICFTKAMVLACVVAAIALATSPLISTIFFPNKNSNVYNLTTELLMIYALCIPLILICQVYTNFLQAMGHLMFVNFQSVFDGFFSMVLPSIILAPYLGAEGVWISIPIGIILTILTVPFYRLMYFRRLPKTLDDYCFFKSDFGIRPENTLAITIENMEQVVQASELVQEFCKEHFTGNKESYYSALCLEEMAGNVITHGFSHDKKPHSLNVRVVYRTDNILLRLRDDCIPFDPMEMEELVKGGDPEEKIGIRMVFKIADEVTYQNLLGLNVLSITIREQDMNLMDETDYLLEKALLKLDPALHRNYKDNLLIIKGILSRYKQFFPEYTDHSILHSITVVNSCAKLIGLKQISMLNKDEIYILLIGCYLHDAGMGIGESDYEYFKDRLGAKEFFEKNPDASKTDFIRSCHHELSGLFIEKYSQLFEFPSPEHTFAIKQVSRGHRKTNLYDEKEYPTDYKLPDGNTVCLPYLAALVRLSDEIDVVASRNPLLLYDMEQDTSEKQMVINKTLQAVTAMKTTTNTFILSAETKEREIYYALKEMVYKMQATLDYCRDVIDSRTKFTLSQKKVILELEFKEQDRRDKEAKK